MCSIELFSSLAIAAAARAFLTGLQPFTQTYNTVASSRVMLSEYESPFPRSHTRVPRMLIYSSPDFQPFLAMPEVNASISALLAGRLEKALDNELWNIFIRYPPTVLRKRRQESDSRQPAR